MSVMGKVRMTMIGFNVKLIRIITAARRNPVVQVFILTPLNKKSAINTEIPPNKILIKTEVAVFVPSIASNLEN